VGLRQRGELLRMLKHNGERRFRGRTGLRVTRRIGLARGEQDMSRFVDVRRPKSRSVLLVIAPACCRIRGRCLHLPDDKGANGRLVIGLAATVAVGHRLSRNFQSACLLQQQFAHRQRPRGGFPCFERGTRRMMLNFARNPVAWDCNPVDPYVMTLG